MQDYDLFHTFIIEIKMVFAHLFTQYISFHGI